MVLPTPPEILPSIQQLLADCRDQMAATNHFGVLGPFLESPTNRTSRLKYVHDQCVLLHRLKKQVQGLGLGSSNFFSSTRGEPGNEWAPLKNLTGLEIAQAWAVLVNAGHLFGTFATERPLLFELDRALALRDAFVSAVCAFSASKGSAFRLHVERMLDRAQLHSFHGLLGLWRLRDGGLSNLQARERAKARLLLKAYLDPPTENLKTLQALFKRVRQLSYLQIHRNVQSASYTLLDATDEDLKRLFPEDGLPETDWFAASRWHVVDAIDRFDAESLFASSEATAEVLAHVAEFREWWAKTQLSDEARIDALFATPIDWPVRQPKALHHFVEIRATSTLGWLHEVRHWLRDDNTNDPWKGADFFITPAARESPLRIDLYATDQGLPVSALEQVTRQLARSFASIGEPRHQQALWISTARLTARAFEALLKPGYSLRLRPVVAAPGHLGYAIAGATYEFVRGRAKGFLPLASDQQRAKEIRQLLAVADHVVGWRNATLLLLAKTELISKIAGTPKAATDLDGVLGYFHDGSLHWLVVETKRSGTQDGAKQLREKFFPSLLSAPAQVESRSFGTDESWYVRLASPDWVHGPTSTGAARPT